MAIVDRVRELVLPIVEAEDVDLYDIEHTGGVLRIFVDVRREPGDTESAIDIEAIKRISRGVSHVLDEADPIPGRYTLEVSSPGLERPLRTADHFRRAIGAEVKIKTMPHVEGDRRIRGVVTAADDDTVAIDVGGETREVGLADIAKARTVFEWGPTPKPGGAQRPKAENAPNPSNAQFPEKKAPMS